MAEAVEGLVDGDEDQEPAEGPGRGLSDARVLRPRAPLGCYLLEPDFHKESPGKPAAGRLLLEHGA